MDEIGGVVRRQLAQRRIQGVCWVLVLAGVFIQGPRFARADDPFDYKYSNAAARMAVHLVDHAKAQTCEMNLPCNPGEASSFSVSGALQAGYDLYIVVCDAEPVVGLAGVRFGIEYDPSLYVGTWSACADASYPEADWPSSGATTTEAWGATSNCQSTPATGDVDGDVSITVGSFYVYAYTSAQFSIVLASDGVVSVSDCASRQDTVAVSYGRLGSAGFPSGGFDTCGPGASAVVASESVTWGMLKGAAWRSIDEN